MSEIVAALIAGAALMAGILVEKLFVLFTDHMQRKKEFLNNFFPERLNAHKEIMRVIAEAKILYLDPKIVSVGLVEEVLIQARQNFQTALLNNALFAAPIVKQGLFDFAKWCERIAEDYKFEHMPLEEQTKTIKALQAGYDKLVGLVLKYSGVDIINKEFDKVVEGRKKRSVKREADKDVSGKEKPQHK